MARKVFDLPADLAQLLAMAEYPGVVPDESRAIREFLRNHGHELQGVAFDVRVGPGEQAPSGVDAAVKRAIEEGTRSRMDAVGTIRPGSVVLIEGKALWDNSAVWQLKGYGDLYAAEHPGDTVRLVGVALGATTSGATLARSQGVHLFVYTFPPGQVDITTPATEGSTDGV